MRERWGKVMGLGNAPANILPYEEDSYNDASCFVEKSFLTGEQLENFDISLYREKDCEEHVDEPLPKFAIIHFDKFPLRLILMEILNVLLCQEIFSMRETITTNCVTILLKIWRQD